MIRFTLKEENERKQRQEKDKVGPEKHELAG